MEKETKPNSSPMNEDFEELYNTLETARDSFYMGYKLCKTVLEKVTVAGLFKKEDIQELLTAVQEKSKKIREDAIEGKIEFHDIQQDISLENYKELVESEASTHAQRKNAAVKLEISNNIKFHYNDIIAKANELNIPVENLIVRTDVEAGVWTVISTHDNSVVYTGKV